MLKTIQNFIFFLFISAFSFADIIITEITDPQNSSDAGRYVELYNSGDSDVDLSTGWALVRWTNAGTEPQSPKYLTGIISAGGFYVVCNDADKFSNTFGLTCDQDIGTGGPADSNGDDNIALLDEAGLVYDLFGVPGVDGTGTGHEFEDGRAERAESSLYASSVWIEADWNIDNDSGGGDGNQYAPEGFDPAEWIGASSDDDGEPSNCEDEFACNTGAEGSCEYPVDNYDCDGNCIADLDCFGACGGDAILDECGECGGNGSSCAGPPANLFFSESAEGSSNNKYIEVYNASGEDVDLSGYSLSSCSNGCDDGVSWDYSDNVTFDAGTILAAGDVYVVCHGSSDPFILDECDQTFTYLSNGDDVFGLTQVGTGVVLDIIGIIGDDPGSGWEVSGVSNATKDHTLVRDESVATGNGGNWELSESTEWLVFDQNTWDYLGSHPHEIAALVSGCMDPNATNYDSTANEQSYNEFGTSTCTYASCSDIPTATGCLWADGTSSEWWEGWWNCAGEGVQVCGLAEVVFELDLPESLSGTPHVNGSYNGWCGSCYNAMSDDDGDGIWTHTQYFSQGEYHDYKFTIDGWNDQEDLTGLECAAEADGYWNRNFVAGEINTSQTLSYCWGTCDSNCSGDDGGGSDDGGTSDLPSDVTFDLDGLDDCGFVSVTGTFDGWSGWEQHRHRYVCIYSCW